MADTNTIMHFVDNGMVWHGPLLVIWNILPVGYNTNDVYAHKYTVPEQF
jgi:hypothetical protein